MEAGIVIRVLVVDDEPAICKAFQLCLERNGYEALTAQTCDAMSLILLAGRVDVLIMDMKIGMDRGDWVFETAKSFQPHLALSTAFMTGDITSRAEELVGQYNCPLLRKPFDLRDLLNVVHELSPRQAQDASA
jgi:DNA-binding NtrC family response regulator